MKAKRASPHTIDQYIAGFPASVRAALQRVRKAIHSAVPDAEEGISYRIPIIARDGYLLYFAAHTSHIGVYPVSAAMKKAVKGLSRYTSGKGTARFPLDKPIPSALIGKMAKFRAKERLAKLVAKAPKRRAIRVLNAGWHRRNRLPPGANEYRRAVWHLAHARACGCRPIPKSVLDLAR
jgi:uncharacterized protein YdhG (YjbR/CyaY superfamily)